MDIYNENEIKIKTICEYLFFDQFQDTASFPRFEQCFQPLFNNINISMESVFKDICGEKKKYINYNRFTRAFINHIKGKYESSDTKTFFEILFSKILKEEKSYVGETTENNYTFCTAKSCKNRECITLVEILSDKINKIHGINLEYDGIFKSKMYPTKIEDELVVSLEMSLGIVDEKPITENKIGKFLGIKQGNYRDAITHIFGTINNEKGLITFLGFKCISGKTVFVGFPDGEGFLFGKFGKKFHNLKLQMTVEGITKIEPGFIQNPRKNFFLGGMIGNFIFQNIFREEIIKDEDQLVKLKDEVAIDKLITTPIVEDNHFFNTKLKDEISGNDYKEVVNQFPRNWIIRAGMVAGKRKKYESKKIMTLSDALEDFNKEYENRAPSKLRAKSQIMFQPNRQDEMSRFLPHGPNMQMSSLLNFSPSFHGPIPIHRGPMGFMPFSGFKSANFIPRIDPWLHKTKVFIPPPRPGISGFFGKKMGMLSNSTPKINLRKWNGKFEKRTQPGLFLHKFNYLGLKERLGKMIHDEFSKKNKGNDNMKQFVLSQIIPYPGRDMRKSRFQKPFFFKNQQLSDWKFLRMKNLKGEVNIFGEENLKETVFKVKQEKYPNKLMNEEDNNKKEESNVIYSDALQMLNDLSDKKEEQQKRNDIKDTDLRSSNKNQKKKTNKKPKKKATSSSKNNKSSKNKKNKNKNQQKQNEEMIDPEKYKEIQEKWINFRKRLEKISGIYLLQTIGSIIKAMKILEGDIEGKSNIPISEKVNLYKMLEENETIVNFLSQERSSSRNQEDVIMKNTEEEEVDDNILIPDEHPEQFTSLEELQGKLEDLKKILDSKKLKVEDKKKIEILYNLYLQQKNILIENETNSAKSDIIKENKINVNKYLQEEQEKRRKAQEEEEKKMEQILKEEEAKQKKNEIIQSILNLKEPNKIYRNQKMPVRNKPWTDDIFPPEKQSLCPFDCNGWVLPEDVWESDVAGWEEFKWCRVEEIYDSKDYNVFMTGSSSDDIQQGNIGDCYFLSVLGSLSAFPDFFDKLFYNKEKTKEHVYGVYIYINGKWELVLVDDYFPYQGTSFKQFAFGSSSEKEIWVSLLEKAWAKVNGCYAKIGCGGLPNEVFDVLTEAYSERKSISNNNKEEIWKICENAVGKGYVMTAGTSGDVSNLNLEEVGLSPAHAYSFLNIYKVETDDGIERVVKLRNPWGNGEYNGSWSDSSKKWTPSTKKQCGYKENSDDGVFYMSYDEFIKYYVTMGIAKLEPGYTTTVCKIEKENAIKCQVLRLTVSEENKKSYVQLYQKNPRIILKDGTYQSTSLSFIMLVDENFKYIKSVASTDMHIGIEEDLKPGKYFVFCDVNYRYVNTNGKIHGYNVTCYSKNPILIENVTERVDSSKALQISLYYYCKQKIDNPIKDKNGILIYISKNYNSELPFMLACFVNPTSINYKVKLELEAKGSKSFCFYNDNIATENDSTVIKEIKSGSTATFSIMKYSLSSMFSLRYTVLSSEEKSPSENKVFKEEGEQIDDNGYLLQYVLEVNDGKGYIIGLENTSKYNFRLKLILEGLTDVDPEFKGQLNPIFDSLPNSKRVFNVRVKPNSEELSFEFTYA